MSYIIRNEKSNHMTSDEPAGDFQLKSSSLNTKDLFCSSSYRSRKVTSGVFLKLSKHSRPDMIDSPFLIDLTSCCLRLIRN